MDVQAFLKSLNLSVDQLKDKEIETLNSWLDDLKRNQLTIEKVKEYVGFLKSAVEEKVVKVENGKKEDMYLKARLEDLMLLSSFLTSHDRAKKALENRVKNMPR